MNTSRYLNGAYLAKVKDWHAGDSPWKASKVLQMIEKHRLAPGSVYDIGCGAGEILVELQKNWKADVRLAGFDISPQAISLAKPKENERLEFHQEDFLETAASPPDLTLVLDVFEHVPDYIGFLESLKARTDWVIFHIPLDMTAEAVLRRSKWMLYMRETYGHLHYFTRETVLAILADVGYEIIDCFYTDDFEITEVAPKGLKQKIAFDLRRHLSRINQRLAASVFGHFNLLLLARGDGRKTARK